MMMATAKSRIAPFLPLVECEWPAECHGGKHAVVPLALFPCRLRQVCVRRRALPGGEVDGLSCLVLNEVVERILEVRCFQRTESGTLRLRQPE
jgi:hypothetical protein